MQYFRCRCGHHESWSSGMDPGPCQGCEKCNTTLERDPKSHRTPIPHDFKPRYNTVTGVIDKEICTRCLTVRLVNSKDT